MSRISWSVLAGLSALLLAAPLWAVSMPGMPDYPAHLASFALIAGEPSNYYAIHWQALPNLASETLVPLTGRVMPLVVAARLFLTATVLLWVAGTALIQRALFGRVGPSVLVSALFAYHANFIWGFLNYSFAIGLVFVTFAAWIATDGRRRAGHLIGFAALFTLIYFSHLFAFAVLLLAIGGYELPALIEDRFAGGAILRRIVVPALLCVPAAFAFLVLKPNGGGASEIAFDFVDTFFDRFESAMLIGFDHPAWPLTVALIALFGWAVWTGRGRVHPRMCMVLALFAAATLLAPEWALGGWGVHMRLPAVLGALAFVALEWKLPRRIELAGAAIALILTAGGAAALAIDWTHYDRQYVEFRSHEDAVPRGARVLTVLDGDSLGWAPDQPYWHMAEFAVIDRGAFTPLMFTTPGQHIVHVRPPFDRFAASTAQDGSPPDIDELDDLAAGNEVIDEDGEVEFVYLNRFQCHFEQALVIEGAGPWSKAPSMLRLRATGSFYRLYDIVPDESCASR